MSKAPTTSRHSCWVRGSVIGRGSFGTVSLGFHRATGMAFAVKSVELCSSPDRIRSLETEIHILSSLDQSPYVVRYLGDDVDGSHRNLHLELLVGGTVSDRKGTKFFDEATVKAHTRCLVSALSHVHSRGIVHCDVKGGNVIVSQDPMVAKLADFGSAMRVGSGYSSNPRGSPLWMAPEVVRGEYQGPESDVWSLGCTVIEMVMGRPAWVDKGSAETLSRIGFSDELPEIPGELSEEGKDFIEKCLRRDRQDRWSCDQLLQHPFVASDSSPRCVLCWVSSDFETDTESESEEEEEISMPEAERAVQFARDRVRELSLVGGGPAWESSDGWVEVRGGVAAARAAVKKRTGTHCQLIIRESNTNSARDAGWEYAGETESERQSPPDDKFKLFLPFVAVLLLLLSITMLTHEIFIYNVTTNIKMNVTVSNNFFKCLLSQMFCLSIGMCVSASFQFIYNFGYWIAFTDTRSWTCACECKGGRIGVAVACNVLGWGTAKA